MRGPVWCFFFALHFKPPLFWFLPGVTSKGGESFYLQFIVGVSRQFKFYRYLMHSPASNAFLSAELLRRNVVTSALEECGEFLRA